MADNLIDTTYSTYFFKIIFYLTVIYFSAFLKYMMILFGTTYLHKTDADLLLIKYSSLCRLFSFHSSSYFVLSSY